MGLKRGICVNVRNKGRKFYVNWTWQAMFGEEAHNTGQKAMKNEIANGVLHCLKWNTK